jgi:hypothetical protein
MATPSLYPSPSQAALRDTFVGKTLAEVPAPAVILDAAALRRNCAMMLQATETLGVQFRAHVKTHKTIELARLQIGEGIRSNGTQSNEGRPVRLIASTVTEIEHMLPWLQECRSQGREVNVSYHVVCTRLRRRERGSV